MNKQIGMMAVVSLLSVTFLGVEKAAAQTQPGLSGNYMGVSGQPVEVMNQLMRGDTNSLLIDQLLGTRKPEESGNTMFEGRFDVPLLPISARGALFVGSESRAFEPTISYDMPVAENTNVYVGGGYTFVEHSGTETPLGDRNSPVIAAGVESAVGNLVIYSNARLRLNRDNSNASPVKVQVGAGYRF
jgi:hypothetical protein